MEVITFLNHQPDLKSNWNKEQHLLLDEFQARWMIPPKSFPFRHLNKHPWTPNNLIMLKLRNLLMMVLPLNTQACCRNCKIIWRLKWCKFQRNHHLIQKVRNLKFIILRFRMRGFHALTIAVAGIAQIWADKLNNK